MTGGTRRTSLLALTALLTLAPAGSAFGHAELMRATPHASQALHRSPSAVELRFSEPVSVPRGAVHALAAGGRDVVAGLTTGTTLVVQARLAPKLHPGKYTVRWHVVADDGHVVRGSYRFKVRRGAAAGGSAPASAAQAMAPDGTSRATTTILLVAALGALALALLSLVAIRRQAGGAPARETRRVVAVDVGLIAVAGFCALSLIGVVAANQSGAEGAGTRPHARGVDAPRSPTAAPTPDPMAAHHGG
jgi:methionine-rich copper-binding protein CopC